MVKYSRQRECILNDLRSRYDHPTADMVYESVSASQPNISLGTVYRNLSLLVENGQILKITTGIGPERFDGHIQPHSHFICRCCGKVTDLDFEPGERIAEEAQSAIDGEVESVSLQFFGRCKECVSTGANTTS